MVALPGLAEHLSDGKHHDRQQCGRGHHQQRETEEQLPANNERQEHQDGQLQQKTQGLSHCRGNFVRWREADELLQILP